ncbi:ATP-binding protein [Solidesulfovibrio magneticus]|nr:ATP-binding protein [Solidesulfovibrio magneticus]
MRLHSLCLRNFRRIKQATILFGDTTFLIGPNNVGKSTVLAAIGCLLSVSESLSEFDYNCEGEVCAEEIVDKCTECSIEAEFRNLPVEANSWRGFKGRLIRYETKNENDSGLSVVFRKSFSKSSKSCIREMKCYSRVKKSEFENIVKARDLIDRGIDSELVEELFPELDKKLSKAQLEKLEEINDIWIVDDSGVSEWVNNPGGIHSVVISKLPLYIKIPAEHSAAALDQKSGELATFMNELFREIREASDNYGKAVKYLALLAEELNPEDQESEFSRMMDDLNGVINSVFPESKLHATASLNDADKSLVPVFTINMSSNVKTPVAYQGTGMIRSAIFALLKFRHEWIHKRKGLSRPLIIGFEEPEIYLHPNAANQMRDTIYDLSIGSSQIICTSHSPYMIDLSRKPCQVLNRMSVVDGAVCVVPFNVSDAYLNLVDKDRTYVKMLIKMDDYISRVFFAKKVIIVEGDTEDIVLRETFSRLPADVKARVYADVQVVNRPLQKAVSGYSPPQMMAMGMIPQHRPLTTMTMAK